MDITEYIDSELYIIVAVLYVIGIVIKKSSVDDKWIPLILGGIGIILTCIYKLAVFLPNDLSEALGLVFSGITQGVLCAAGSVYANNILKQLKKDKEKTDDESNNKSNNQNVG